MITIFDYGAGNLRSVQNTLREIGAKYTLVDDAEGLRTADIHEGGARKVGTTEMGDAVVAALRT